MSDRCNCEWGALGTGRLDSNRCLVHDFTHDELVEHFIKTINVYEKDYTVTKSRVAKLEAVSLAARVIVYEYSGKSLFVEGFVSKIMMYELEEALKAVESE